MPDAPPPLLARTWRAASRPGQLKLLAGGALAAGAAAGFGVALATPIPAIAVGALTLLAWGAGSLWDGLYEPALRGGPDPTPPPPAGPHLADPTLRAGLDAVRRAAARVKEAIAGVEGPLEGNLVEAEASCRELEEGAVRLATRGDHLLSVAAEVAGQGLPQRWAELDQKAKTARDPQARARWKEAAERTRAQLDHARELAGAAERTHAELAAVESALGELHTRILRMDASGLDEAGGLRDTLRSMDDELAALETAAEATLKELDR